MTYTPANYQNALKRACRKAGVEEFHPHQLPHAHATEVRKRVGLEGAASSLGHARPDAAAIDAARNLDLAARVASEIG